jgi:sugar-specific transcriptional regulator TrmB
MEPEHKLADYLALAGIEPAATQAYIALVQRGPLSALELATSTHISRTQVYRHLEKLQSYGLVQEQKLSYTTLFSAQPLTNLQAHINQRAAQTTTLRATLSDVDALVLQLAGGGGPQAATTHYYGQSGLKQALWNITKAKTECRVFETEPLGNRFTADFVRRLHERLSEVQLERLILTNHKLSDIAPAFTHCRRTTIPIQFDVYLHGNTTTLLDYRAASTQAIEIRHPALHAFVRQLFDTLWELSRPGQVSTANDA